MRIRPALASRSFTLLAIAIVFAFALVINGSSIRIAKASPDEPLEKTPVEAATAGEYTISGPYTHENLSVFLIHGKERISNDKILTLQEAMASKKVKVYETGDVNELSIQNFSNEEVFIQSGEIVKGGKQDRVIGVDMILSAKSGRVPIESFCVESNRWQERGGEDVKAFSGSTASLNSKSLKLAARYDKNQSKVWGAVAKSQEKLTSAVGESVADGRSTSSLQLTLENGQVKKLADTYVAKLRTIADGQRDVIGYAFAINGEINSADVYGSGKLFRKLWTKMLHAAAVEAVSERAAPPAAKPASPADVGAVLSDAEKGAGTKKESAGKARGYSYESERNVMFETRDEDSAGGWVHRSYMTK